MKNSISKIKRVPVVMLAAVLLLMTCLEPVSVFAKTEEAQYAKTEEEQYEEAQCADTQSEEAQLEETQTEEIQSEETTSEETQSEKTQSDETQSEEAQWTILMYMCGSDLESDYGLATMNLETILSAPACDKVNYVVQTGGASAWQYDDTDISADKLGRYVISDNELKLVEEKPLDSMAEPDVLADFIKWGVKEYPAKKTMLILWDHGGAVMGACVDEIYSNDLLTVGDIQKALEDGGHHFDVICFDACLMADLDIEYALSPYVDYMVASEEQEPGYGIGYEALTKELSRNPQMNSKYLCKKVCDGFVDFYELNNNAGTYTMSVTDLSKISKVRDAVDEMIEAMILSLDDSKQMSKILTTAEKSYGYAYDYEKDLVTLAENLTEVLGEKITENVVDAVEEAVIYKTQFNESKYNNGLTFFWGIGAPATVINDYAEFAKNDRYLAFIDACRFDYEAPVSVYENTELLPDINYDDFKLTLSEEEKDLGFDKLKILSGANSITKVTYGIYRCDEYENYYKVGEFGNLSANADNTEFTVNFKGKQLCINGIPAVFTAVKETDDYVIYGVPLRYVYDENSALDVELRVLFTPDEPDMEKSDSIDAGIFEGVENGRYEIMGIYNDSLNLASDFLNRDIIDLVEGLEFRVLYPRVESADYEMGYVEGESFVYNAATAVTAEDIPDGEYGYAYMVKNYEGNISTTAINPFYVENGEVVKLQEDESIESKEDGQQADNSSYKQKELDRISNMILPFKDLGKGEYHVEVKKGKAPLKKADSVQAKAATVFMYLDGSDLEDNYGYSTSIIDSVIKSQDYEDVNFILQTGGSNEWKGDGIEAGSMQRFEVHNGHLTEVEKHPRTNMGSYHTLEDFLVWGAQNYPAEHYVLMIFDHGDAWQGACLDDTYGTQISLEGIAAALKNSNIHFDDIIFNCCLMSTVEVAAKLAPYADYMVASEQEAFAIAFNENLILDYIGKHAESLNGYLLGKRAVNVMMQDIDVANADGTQYQEFGLIDLSKMPEVVAAVDDMASEMIEVLSDTHMTTDMISELLTAKSVAYTYQKDLGDFARVNSFLSEDVKSRVLNAVNDAVVYMDSSEDRDRSSGLTIYFDSNAAYTKGRDVKKYSKECPSMKYLAFLDALVLGWHPSGELAEKIGEVLKINPTDYNIDFRMGFCENNKVQIQILSDFGNLAAGFFDVYAVQNDSYVRIGRYGNISVDTDNQLLTLDFKGKVITIDGTLCDLSVISENEEYCVFSTDVLKDGVRKELRIKYYYPEDDVLDDGYYGAVEDYADGKFEIIGLFSESGKESGLMELDKCELRNGEEFTPILTSYGFDGIVEEVLGESITYYDGIDVGCSALSNGDYAIDFVLENGIKGSTTTDLVDVVIKNGDVYEMTVPDDFNESDELIISTSGGQKIDLRDLSYCANAEIDYVTALCETDGLGKKETACALEAYDELPVVYYTSDISADGLVKAFDALYWKPKGNVAVKISTGESSKSNHLSADLIEGLVEKVRGTIVECNTAYEGSRSSSEDHYRLAEEHGYTAIADVDIMDEEGSVALEVNNGELLTENYVGSHFENYDSFIVLSHFKGHAMAGFGGAIKNASIGIASAPEGKIWIHTGGRSTTDFMDELMTGSAVDDFQKAMAEAALSVSDAVGSDNIVYINVMNNVSVDCDCDPNPSKPDIHDVGILVSTDPVALDEACVELASRCEGSKSLMYRIADRHGMESLAHGQDIGLGIRQYKLVNLDRE